MFVRSLLIIILTITIYAQEYSVRRYSMRDGMPSNQVLDLLQSDDGIMWFACPIGVFSYDGKDWELYSSNTGLPGTEYIRLRKDSKGYIWALPSDLYYSIGFFDGKKWNRIPKIFEQISGSKVESNFDIIHRKDGSIEISVLYDSKLIFNYNGSKWQQLNTGIGNNPINIRTLNYYRDTLVFASKDGLYKYHSGKIEPWIFLNNQLPGKIISDFNFFEYSNNSGLVLFGSDWIGIYSNSKLNILNRDIYLPRVGVKDRTYYGLLADENGRVYYCNDLSMYYSDELNKNVKLNISQYVRFSPHVRGIIDREKNIWITNRRNVIKLRRTLFKSYSMGKDLVSEEVSALNVLSNGTVILGQYGSISKIDGNDIEHIKFKDYNEFAVSNARVMDIFEDSKNRIWLAVFNYGVGLYENERIRWIKNVENLVVNSIAENDENEIIVGTSNGLYKIIAGNTLERIKGSDFFIRKLKSISKHSLAVCSHSKGLFIYKDDEIKNYVSSKNNANSLFNCLMDPRYGLLVGSKAGLFRVEGDSLKKFDSFGLRIDNPVYLIQAGKKGEIWFGTDNGVIMWDGHKIRTYSSGDGLIGTEANRSAGDIDENGCFWIGTNLGASKFIGSLEDQEIVPPIIEIVKVETPDGDYNFINGNTIVLQHDRSSLTVHYRGISFIDENMNTYKVEIKGLDGTLNDIFETKENRIRFSSLSPGQYRFCIDAINSDGMKSSEPAILNFEIKYPYYYSIWFILSVIVLLFILSYFVIVYLNQRSYSVRLESEVKSRTEELSQKVTQLSLTETALRESEEQFRNVFINSETGIYQTFVSGGFKLANPAMLKILGYSSFKELAKVSVEKDIYYSKDERKEFIELLRDKKRVNNFEIKLRHASGRIIYANVSSRIFKNDDDDEIIEGTIEDITDKIRAANAMIEAKEKAEKSDKLKSQFLAQMSHEIRTPINSILNFSALLKDDLQGRVNEDLEIGFSIIQNAGRRIMRTIDLLLNMSELQTGTYEMNSRIFNLGRELLDNLYLEFKVLAKEKGLEFKMNDLSEVGGIVLADEYTVGQIFNNLIDNAIKYTDNGVIELKLYEEGKNKLIVEVIDTGIGISEEFIPAIFNPFTQEEAGYTRKYEGNGLGLALVKEYCDLNGIHLSIHSKKNQGTIFRLIFKSRNHESY